MYASIHSNLLDKKVIIVSHFLILFDGNFLNPYLIVIKVYLSNPF